MRFFFFFLLSFLSFDATEPHNDVWLSQGMNLSRSLHSLPVFAVSIFIVFCRSFSSVFFFFFRWSIFQRFYIRTMRTEISKSNWQPQCRMPCDRCSKRLKNLPSNKQTLAHRHKYISYNVHSSKCRLDDGNDMLSLRFSLPFLHSLVILHFLLFAFDTVCMCLFLLFVVVCVWVCICVSGLRLS